MTLLDAVATDRVAGAGRPATGCWSARWADDRVTLEAVLPRRTSVVRAGGGRACRGPGAGSQRHRRRRRGRAGARPRTGQGGAAARASRGPAGPGRCCVLTKADLVADAAELVAELAGDAPGVETFAVSTATGEGIEQAARVRRAPTGRSRCWAPPASASRRWSTRWSAPRCCVRRRSAPTGEGGTRRYVASWCRCRAAGAWSTRPGCEASGWPAPMPVWPRCSPTSRSWRGRATSRTARHDGPSPAAPSWRRSTPASLAAAPAGGLAHGCSASRPGWHAAPMRAYGRWRVVAGRCGGGRSVPEQPAVRPDGQLTHAPEPLRNRTRCRYFETEDPAARGPVNVSF